MQDVALDDALSALDDQDRQVRAERQHCHATWPRSWNLPLGQAYEEQTRLVMQPLVLDGGVYSASLDGMTLDGDLIVEIKVPLPHIARNPSFENHHRWRTAFREYERTSHLPLTVSKHHDWVPIFNLKLERGSP